MLGDMQLFAPRARPKAVALLLTGAITMGAFEAGVLKVLAEREIPIRRIVAASSGALNGTVYAAGVRGRCELEMAQRLLRLWRDKGGICDVVSLNLRNILGGKGLSDQDKLLSLLRREVPPTRAANPAPIELNLIVAPLNGALGSMGGEPATTYTRVLRFDDEQFDRRDLLEEVFATATASSAFPVLFTPVDLPGIGACIDGGLINSMPIRFAYGPSEPPIDTLLVIASTPTVVPPPRRTYRWTRLLSHVTEMIFSEQLYWDLREIRANYTALRRIKRLAEQRGWGPEELEELKTAIGEQANRTFDVVTIRPFSPLRGEPFSGFFSAAIRRHYIDAGIERATELMDTFGWH